MKFEMTCLTKLFEIPTTLCLLKFNKNDSKYSTYWMEFYLAMAMAQQSSTKNDNKIELTMQHKERV